MTLLDQAFTALERAVDFDKKQDADKAIAAYKVSVIPPLASFYMI